MKKEDNTKINSQHSVFWNERHFKDFVFRTFSFLTITLCDYHVLASLA